MTAGFAFPEISVWDPAKTAEGLWLILLKATRVPPHLGILADGRWFTLDINGAKVNGDGERLLQAVQRKKIPAAFVRFAWPRGLSKEKAQDLLTEIFSVYQPLGETPATCFSPIRDFCEKIYGEQYRQPQFVFQLLRQLEKDGLFNEVSGLHVANKNFVLPHYDMQAVRNSIASAKLRAG
ncbi:MAG: hypothetical protein FD123_3489 [Bacteroidetes bacterium]|nr:MAG: hypothetical protein FD123_3489 [Bacteroidota bacterium]